ncbi:MAG: hypothetical protein RI910_2717 [Verrucomicrobiota bacterium]|jgi:hypothetical protein
MYKYKLTAIGFYPEFELLYKQVFGDAVHVESLVAGNVAIYGFSTPQTPADLGPLVRVELLTNDNP